MVDNNINTAGRGPAVLGIEETLEGWRCVGNMIKESFSAVEKSYDPVQEMLTKEHEAGLRMMVDPDISEERYNNASQHVRETREAAQELASKRMADVLKIVGTVATVTVTLLGGTQYVKYAVR